MTCDVYQKHEVGDLDELSFQRHVRNCADCQQRVQRDDELMTLAGTLDRPMPPEYLWGRIEVALESEPVAQPGSSTHNEEHEVTRPQQSADSQTPNRRVWIYRAAAVLLVGVGLGGGYVQFSAPAESTSVSSLYSPAALEKVRDREREYVAAIEELEQSADAQLGEMDLDLKLLYRDKIQTIDTQIARCLEALHNNPANTHIRRYLLLALQDKRETLQEIVQLEL